MNGEFSPSAIHASLFSLPHTRSVKPLPRLKRRKTAVLPEANALPSPQAALSTLKVADGHSSSISDRQAPLSPKETPNPASTSAPQQNQFALWTLPPYYYPFFAVDHPTADQNGYNLDPSNPSLSGADHFSTNGPGYYSSTTISRSRLHSPPSPYLPLAASIGSFSVNLSTSSLHYGMFSLSATSSSEDEEDPPREAQHGEARDRDQQGNTKKRKVPAMHQRARNSEEPGPSLSGQHDGESKVTITEKQELPVSNNSAAALQNGAPGPGGEKRPNAGGKKKSNSTITLRAQNRMSSAALAYYRNNEVLRVRKRQLSIVLGPSALIESFALDQAVLTRLPWHMALGKNPEDSQLLTKETPLGRKRRRPLRPMENYEQEVERPTKLPEQDFTFNIPSPTSERMVATQREASMIRSRFETELARQAQKLAESARTAASSANTGGVRSRNAKRNDADSQRKLTTPSGPGVNNSGSTLHPPDTAGPNESNAAAKPRGSKKKKRSALANASNPHHLRNYVPSRVPSSIGGTSALTPAQLAINTQNAIGPLPLHFLSADLPPRKNRGQAEGQARSTAQHSNIQVTAPVDEWICSFCEYALFFGGEAEYRKAIRSRKKVLSRRRRARERAAAAASGQTRVKKASNSTAHDTDEENVENAEDQFARFVDPKIVDERVEATMRGIPVIREKG